MPRAKTNKLYRTFVKGLITEAGYLTYPEDASVDELNTVLSRKGNRTRRLGARYEEGFTLNPVEIDADDAVNEFVWESVAQVMGKSFTVIQIGAVLHFWEMDTVPLSDNKLPFTVNLNDYKGPASTELEVRTTEVHFSSGSGLLFVAHAFVEPLCIEFDKVNNTLSVFRVVIQIRDFEGVYDGLPNDAEPVSLTKEHQYNLMNQGWMAPGTIPIPALAAGELPITTGDGGAVDNDGAGSSDGSGGTYYDPYTGNEYTKYPRNNGNPLQ